MTLEIELTINKGRSYVQYDEQPEKDNIIGVIPIDSIYTPVKNVAYRVSNTRVNYNVPTMKKLTIEVKTDGTIHPEEQLKKHPEY